MIKHLPTMPQMIKHLPTMPQMIKRLPTMWKTQVRSLDWEYPLEKEMATHSSGLVWKIPWMKEPGRLQSTGSQSLVGYSPQGCKESDMNERLHFTSSSYKDPGHIGLRPSVMTPSETDDICKSKISKEVHIHRFWS